MVNHPNRSLNVTADFTLPGGLPAIAVWRRGAGEGAIYADPEWLENNDDGTRRIAENRADDATGADEIEWLWQPMSELDKQHGNARRR